MNLRTIILSALAAAAGGCAEIDESPVFFDLVLEPTGVDGFVTQTGWSVTLDEAVIAVGPVYLRDEGAHFRSGSHGGDAEGLDETLAGEFIQQVAFDLTGPGLSVGEGRGTVRRVDVLEPVLAPPDPQILGEADALGDAPAVVRGVAVRGAIVVEFVGALGDVEDPGEEPGAGETHGDELEVDPFALADGGTLTLVIDPSRWFDEAHFDQLVQIDGEGRHVITPSSQVGLEWAAARVDAFAPTWSPASPGTDG